MSATLQEQWDAFDYARWTLALERSKRSFFYFVERVLQLKEYVNEYRASLDLAPIQDYGWHIKHWCELPHKYRFIHIKAPRDHWKTSMWTIAFLLWRGLFKDSMYAASEIQPLANKKLTRVKQLVDSRLFFNPPDPDLRALIPTRINPNSREGWAETEIKFSNGATLTAVGFTSATRGPHPKVIVVDDIHSERQKYSMDYAKEHFYSTIRNMLVEGGYLVVVGTTFALNDLYADLENNLEFTTPPGYCETLQAVIDWDKKEVLWPEWMSYEQLIARRASIGHLRFNREFQNQALSEETSLFPLSLLQKNFDTSQTFLYNYEGDLPIFSGWDLAIATTEGADYTVGMTCALDEFGNRILVDIFREDKIGYSAQWAAIENIWNRFRPQLIHIEANAYQRALPDEMARYTDIPVEPYVTGSEKHSFEVGLPSLRKLFENQKFKLPRGDERSRALTDLLCYELQSLTFQEGKVTTVAEHDDMAMALWIMDAAILKWRDWQGWFGSIEWPT